MKRIFEKLASKNKPCVEDSLDSHPWSHPFLEDENIKAFREYSELVWSFALEEEEKETQPLDCAFAVNMAQNMYKWATLAQEGGAKATLYPHPQDVSALSRPEWEEFDGEFTDLMDGSGFLKENPIELKVPCKDISMSGSEYYTAYESFKSSSEDRRELLKILSIHPTLRHEALITYQGCYSYIKWASTLAQHDVVYIASTPPVAYFSGKPYSAFSVGGDMQFDCGKAGWYGELMTLSFNNARFIMLSNPHALGHCRRLGFTNGVYLPYPMDSEKYCPGVGAARAKWVEELGEGVFVLTTSRLDSEVKGQGQSFFDALKEAIKKKPELRFVFLLWGNSAEKAKETIQSLGISKNVLILPPVGKVKLIDYYRSCDVVLDTFVYGYYGATALEAASIGKPVIMKLREEHYAPLYNGDIMPVENVSTPERLADTLTHLAGDEKYRKEKGVAMREWLLRNHGQERTTKLMLALLRLTAKQTPLPNKIADKNPLLLNLTDEEIVYHKSCLIEVEQD